MMKLFSDIKHLVRNCSLASAALFSVLSLNSCADDLEVRTDSSDGKFDPSALTIYIPDVESAAEYGRTRAESTVGLADVNEAAIKKLSFFAYPVTESGATANDGREPIIVIGMTPSENGSTVFQYSRYDIKGFQAGHYKFYLVANLDRYLPSGTSLNTSISESDLLDIVLNFANTTDKYLVSGELPMACLNNEFKTGESDNTKITTGIYKFEGTSGTSKSLYADLTFLCSKVRYTILFDQKESGNTFTSYDVDFTGAVANNVRQQYAWAKGTANDEVHNSFSLFARKHTKVAYPETGSKYLTGLATSGENNDQYVKDLDGISLASQWTSPEQRAWQGTIYLPVNANSSKKTSLHFTASGSGVSDEGYELTFDELAKGKFYDAVVHLKTSQSIDQEVTVSVNNWTTQNLSYQLHGPYELIVETTELEVSTNNPGLFWYRSDVAPDQIRFAFPTISINGNDINFYTASVLREHGKYVLNEAGDYQIQVKVNPSVPINILQQVNNEENGYKKSNYQYIEVIAGNLQKKIKINPLTLSKFLNVTPNYINLDVREYVTSGLKAESLDILLETNINNSISFSVAYDPSSSTQKMYFNNTGDVPLALNPGDGTTSLSSGQITSGTMVITDGTGHLSLDLKKLFDGSTFWQYEQTITITFTATYGSGSSQVTDSGTLTIYIKPYTTDYVIHFRANNSSDWTNPHIYIYQCLEMPSTTTYAGRTVGFPTDDKKGNAGLEYIFTNNIAFKGWQGFGGSVNPSQSGTGPNSDNAFIYWGSSDSDHKKFNPEVGNSGNTDVYNYTIDLNHQHDIWNYKGQSWLKCKCQYYDAAHPGYWNGAENFDHQNGKSTGSGQHIYAGVAMIKESGINDGWYKYTLSGVATPGKAMIMFANDHNSADDNSGKRYPNNNQVGVPLFDFPDHEGWFWFDGESDRHDIDFSDDKPTTAPVNKNYVDGSNTWYLKGDFNSWTASSKYKFTYQSEGVWVTQNFTCYSDQGFKIGDISGWDKVNYGSNGSSDKGVQILTSSTKILQSNGKNFKTPDGDFSGYAKLTKTGSNYYLQFVGTVTTPRTTFQTGEQIKIYWYAKDGYGVNDPWKLYVNENVPNWKECINNGKENYEGAERYWTVYTVASTLNNPTQIECNASNGSQTTNQNFYIKYSDVKNTYDGTYYYVKLW